MKKPCLRDELKQGGNCPPQCAVIKLFQMTVNRHRRLANGLPPNQGYRRQSGLQSSQDTQGSLPF